jgi:ABC-type uncharacterized transport system ATPase component
MVTHNVFAATYGHRTLEVRDGKIVRDMRAGSSDAESPDLGGLEADASEP